VVVEHDKLRAAGRKALEAVDSRCQPGDDDFDLESLEVTGGDDLRPKNVSRDDIVDAPVVRFVNKVLLDAIKRGASDIHFEPYEKIYRVRYPPRRRAEAGGGPAAGTRRQGRRRD
jgi:type IV pilus assembly protein PilB